MPSRPKRKAEEFDPTKSDSDDSTYGASVSRPGRPKPSKSQRSKPARKRQRRDYNGDDSEELSDESEISEASLEPEQGEEAEFDEKTGRPKRQAAKKRPTYQESDEESLPEELAEEPTTPKRRPVKKSLMIKLNVRTPQPTPAPTTRRSTRARSGSVGARPPSSEMHPGTRRSSRIHNDETEVIVALTDSGHHANIVRPATKSPEPLERPRRGGKSMKTLPITTSVVFEEEESSGKAQESIEDEVQAEVAASRDGFDEIADELQAATKRDSQTATTGDTSALMEDVAVIPESGDEAVKEADDDDEDPVSQPGRTTRRALRRQSEHIAEEPPSSNQTHRRSLRSGREQRRKRHSHRSAQQESSDFEPGFDEGEEENVSDSEASSGSPRKASQNDEDASQRSRRAPVSEEHDSEEAEELAEELHDLQSARPRRAARAEILFNDKPKRRARKQVDYRIMRPDLALQIDDDGPPSATTPSKRARGGGGWNRSLYSTYGPFGGAGGPTPVFGGPGGLGAVAGADSDSSDDEIMARSGALGVGGQVGMTPTAAGPPGFGTFPPAQAHGADALQKTSGTPANLGKVNNKQALADTDPLGVDQNVNFDSIGGLQGYIDQLKEMVALPLLYPEIFQRFHVTPPRGVLFHGPPGTGKTLMARALASSVSTQGRKVTFYMRKGADALSKWVGEAERQLRLLFEEARKTQPSIIFFDEIDGLAPVRSSKQEQIHSSIVSTLLALMDGMDGRGQVIVIGATNRPDTIDPALRRPGRFDREFYFPLPNTEARRSILDIHTKGWDPPLESHFKDELALQTKGYGGADLRALCTEAALNAVQRRYPQIYKSNEKLIIRPETINVTAKDFMISVKKMVPSSERSSSSGAAPLPTNVEPLLRRPLLELKNVLGDILPQKKRLTALEEAEFEDAEDDKGMEAEQMQQNFESSRVFRPRLLVKGVPGMGQQYLAGALLNHFEGLHVQSFDLPTLLSDSTRSSEAALIQLFTEVRRHKPGVIYIPNVNVWYSTLNDAALSTFIGLLRTLAPTDPVLLLGILEGEDEEIDPAMIKKLFGYSLKNQYLVQRPARAAREEYFAAVINYLNLSPADFPEPANRKKRKLEALEAAPPPPPEKKVMSKTELKEQKRMDRHWLNSLKLLIQPIMDQIKLKYKKFRTGVVEESQIRYLYDEDDPSILTSDLPTEQRRETQFRPYEKGHDAHGQPGLVEQSTGNFFYNMEIVTIEKRLSNGYYKRPRDFLDDVKKLTKDAKMLGDADRLLKANEIQTNVEVDMSNIEFGQPALIADLEQVWIRETQREKERIEKTKQAAAVEEEHRLAIMPSEASHEGTGNSAEQSSGPIVLGQPIANGAPPHPYTPSNPSQPSQLTNGYSNGLLSDLSDLRNRPQSNGTSVPSRSSGDLQVSTSQENQSPDKDTQSSSFGQSAQTRPFHHHTGGPASLEQRRSYPGSLSQRSAITPMVEGSNPNDYTNYASTTSSGKKESGSSGPLNTQNTPGNTQNTHSSHGKPAEGPDISMIPEPAASNSQYPDTQNTQGSAPSSQSTSSQPSQTPAVPAFPSHRPSNINALLNNDENSPPSSQLRVDHQFARQLLETLIVQTSGCSVEQLEQVYSAIMDKIWKTRGDWNRVRVVEQVGAVLEEVLRDMRQCQEFQMGSMVIE